MYRIKWLALVAVLAMISTLVAVPAAAGHGSNGKVCVVNSIGGDDDPFNASVADGTKAAKAKFHVEVETANAEIQADVEANIDHFVTSGDCDLIVGVGFTVAFLMAPFISANPGQDFVMLDFSFGGIHPNVAEVIFESNEAAFLAGYVAAGLSDTGKVGVFGGLPIPPVTVFMDGYALGVDFYNTEHGTSVEVLGWDPDLQSGLFTFNFDNPADGQAAAAALYDLGADTVFPVAGFTSFGALFEADLRKAAGEEVRVVGVDFDWAGTFGDPERVILTSVMKNYGPAVFNQIGAFVDGSWSGGTVFEGLESGAVDIAKFHKVTRDVPGFLKNDLKSIRAGIIDDSIPTLP